MDKYYELMVEKERKGSQLFKILGIYILGIIVASIVGYIGLTILTPFMGIIFMLVVLIIFGTWYLSTKFFVEFEYIITNGDIDIDKITAKKARKRLLNFSSQSVTEGGKFNRDKFKNTANFQKVIYAQKDEESAYYMVCKHQNLGRVLVVFSPNRKMIDMLKPFLPREVFYAFDNLK